VSLPVYLHSKKITFIFQVWDQDPLTDDFLGQYEVTIDPSWPHFGQIQSETLSPRPDRNEPIKIQGSIQFKISYHYRDFSKTQLTYKYHNHKITGLARTVSSGEKNRGYATYQISLHHVPDIFSNQKNHWNEAYDSAKKIFNSSVIKGTIITQHNHLYSEISVSKTGSISSGEEFLQFLKYGYKGGKPRFFTYAIMEDTWFFSETGAAFFVDFTSKHAMHACCQDDVYYAGEFVIVPSGAPSEKKYKLSIDNNSGTYAPKQDRLEMLKRLLELNFPNLEVETNDYKLNKEVLSKYKKYVETGEWSL